MFQVIAATTLEKLKDVPKNFWINAAIIIGIIVLSVIVIRYIRQMNKIILVILIAMVATIVGFNWIYERNEPAFLTPAVDAIAQFFPTKGMYGETQKQETPGSKAKKENKTPPKK